MGLHLPDPNPHLLTCSAEPFNKTRIIAWHYFNHIPSVEYLADDKHAPGSTTRNPLPPFPCLSQKSPCQAVELLKKPIKILCLTNKSRSESFGDKMLQIEEGNQRQQLPRRMPV